MNIFHPTKQLIQISTANNKRNWRINFLKNAQNWSTGGGDVIFHHIAWPYRWMFYHRHQTPVLTSSYCHLFRPLQNDLRGKHFESPEHIKNESKKRVEFFFLILLKNDKMLWSYLRLTYGTKYNITLRVLQFDGKRFFKSITDSIILGWKLSHVVFLTVS